MYALHLDTCLRRRAEARILSGMGRFPLSAIATAGREALRGDLDDGGFRPARSEMGNGILRDPHRRTFRRLPDTEVGTQEYLSPSPLSALYRRA